MTDVTNELMYEVLKRIQTDTAVLKEGQASIKQEIVSVRKQLHVIQGDNLRQEQTVAGVQLDIDRIKTRLDLSDA